MSVEFVDNQAGAQPAQPAQPTQPAPAPVVPVQQVPQHHPVPAPQFYIQPQPIPQPAPQPAAGVSKEDLAVLANSVTELKVQAAITSFMGAHADAKEVFPAIVEYTRANPDIWALGHDKALEHAYKAVKYDAMMAATTAAQETTQQTVDEINATKANLTATQTQGGTPPASQNTEEDDYGTRLVNLSRSANIFG